MDKNLEKRLDKEIQESKNIGLIPLNNIDYIKKYSSEFYGKYIIKPYIQYKQKWKK